MNNEIKEMTKVLNSLGNKQVSELYYYITNLEQELKEEKRINQEDLKLIDELQEELLNKKLNVKDIEYKEKMVYKSRIEKAIEYINTHYLNANEPKLLNILNGGDEE